MFAKIFDWIKKLFRKLLSLIKKILPVVMLLLAVWLALGMPFTIPLLGEVIAGTTANALLVAGASFLLAPGETAKLVSNVAAGLGSAAGAVAAAAAGAASTGIGAFFQSPVGIGVLAFGVWFLLLRDKKDEPGGNGAQGGAPAQVSGARS